MKIIAVIFTVCLLLGLALPSYAQVYNPANGHYYELVTTEGGWTWDDARNTAAAMSYNGMPGHLATVTSQAENDFIVNEWPGIGSNVQVWLGGTDAVSEGDWRWITGETWSYTNWNGGEPNNAGGNEDCLTYKENEQWNDELCTNEFWYLVEFEPANVPTMNEWGMIIFAALAGIGSVYYLRKRYSA
jgi:hypothetical protein